MTRAHRRYLAMEAGIAAVINAILSFGFVLLAFGGRADVPLAGRSGMIFDALPQSFMVALMSCLVPTLLTRRRMAAGAVAPLPAGSSRWPSHAILRAVPVAAIVAGVAWGVQAAVLPATGTSWRFVHVAVFKCLFGAGLGAVVAAFSVRSTLAERLRPTRP